MLDRHKMQAGASSRPSKPMAHPQHGRKRPINDLSNGVFARPKTSLSVLTLSAHVRASPGRPRDLSQPLFRPSLSMPKIASNSPQATPPFNRRASPVYATSPASARWPAPPPPSHPSQTALRESRRRRRAVRRARAAAVRCPAGADSRPLDGKQSPESRLRVKVRCRQALADFRSRKLARFAAAEAESETLAAENARIRPLLALFDSDAFGVARLVSANGGGYGGALRAQ